MTHRALPHHDRGYTHISTYSPFVPVRRAQAEPEGIEFPTAQRAKYSDTAGPSVVRIRLLYSTCLCLSLFFLYHWGQVGDSAHNEDDGDYGDYV